MDTALLGLPNQDMCVMVSKTEPGTGPEKFWNLHYLGPFCHTMTLSSW